MKKCSKWHILLSLILALAIVAGTMLPVTAFAEGGSPETFPAELTITGLELPRAGSVFPASATVSSAEGISWQIPVLWLDDTGTLTSDIAGDGKYYPVFALFIPEGIAVQGKSLEFGSISLTIDEAILAQFDTEEIRFVYDADTAVTYIILGAVIFTPPTVVPAYGPLDPGQEAGEDISFRNPNFIPEDAAENAFPDGGKNDASPVSTADNQPVKADKPTESAQASESEETSTPESQEVVSVPSTQAEEPVPQEEALPLDLVPVHCAQTAQRALEPEELASLVDLIRYRIQPQAVNILLDRFPAFQAAYEEGMIGQDLGLYIYAFKGDKDGIKAHQNIQDGWTAFARSRLLDYTDYCYMMGIDARYFFEVNERNQFVKDKETGKYMLTEDEQKIQNIESTIIHEMLHLFMYDYNRVGMTGTTDPEMWRDPELSKEDRAELYKAKFPTWFTEGLACSVQNTYQRRNFAFQRLRYLGDGEYDDYYTPENVLSAYQMTQFQMKWVPKEFTSHFDLETADDKNVENKVDAQYASGYLACLYLAELAANQKGESSVTQDETGSFIMKSDPLREGINTILERLHNGETLDELIEDISGGRFSDTAAFERGFIKGDEDSLDFCVVYLNYMQELSEESDREYLPNGSILLDFDLDYASPLDRNVKGVQNAFVFTDSDDVVPSTVELLRAYTNGGRSYRGLFREEDFADREDAADEKLFPEEDSMDWDDENASEDSFYDESLQQVESEDPASEDFAAFEEESPAQAFESYTEESYSYEGDSASQEDWGGGWDEEE